jgi:hypothetical protein
VAAELGIAYAKVQEFSLETHVLSSFVIGVCITDFEFSPRAFASLELLV